MKHFPMPSYEASATDFPLACDHYEWTYNQNKKMKKQNIDSRLAYPPLQRELTFWSFSNISCWDTPSSCVTTTVFASTFAWMSVTPWRVWRMSESSMRWGCMQLLIVWSENVFFITQETKTRETYRQLCPKYAWLHWRILRCVYEYEKDVIMIYQHVNLTAIMITGDKS